MPRSKKLAGGADRLALLKGQNPYKKSRKKRSPRNKKPSPLKKELYELEIIISGVKNKPNSIKRTNSRLKIIPFDYYSTRKLFTTEAFSDEKINDIIYEINQYKNQKINQFNIYLDHINDVDGNPTIKEIYQKRRFFKYLITSNYSGEVRGQLATFNIKKI